MAERVVTQEDIEFLISESELNGDLNMLLVGMISLLDGSNEKYELIEKQSWFKCMSNVILGKNGMTQEEITKNREKINLYIVLAMEQLFNRNCIDPEIVLLLSNKIYELYLSRNELQSTLGSLAQKLDQETESFDTFQTIIDEINQDEYSKDNPFLSISWIMSQLDLWTIDDREMDILKNALKEKKILNNDEVYLRDILEEMLSVEEDAAGILALFYGSIRNEYIAEITEKTICAYYMLPAKTRKMKNKHAVVESILKSNDIDMEYKISSHEMYMTLMGACLINIEEIAGLEEKLEEQIEEQQNINQEKDDIEKYIQDSMNLLSFLANMVNTWGADNDEMNTHETREKYSKFMMSVSGHLNKKSPIGSTIFKSLNNLACLAQKVSSKHADIRISKIVKKDVIDSAKEFCDEEDYGKYVEFAKAMATNKVNASYALEVTFQDLDYVQHTEYKTIAEYFRFFLKFLFREERYTLNVLNAISVDFPNPSGYSSTEFMGYKHYMTVYKNVYHIFLKMVLDRISNNDFLKEIHGLIQKYPVVYDGKYKKIFTRDTKRHGPYIEFEYLNFNEKKSSIGYANICNFESYSTTKILVKFRVGMREYTPKFIIIENDYMDASTCDYYEYVDIGWGDWVGNNAAELIIHKNEHEVFGNVKIKIIIEENPNIVGFISFS